MMRLTTDKQSLLRALLAERVCSVAADSFRTGLDELDQLAPGGAFQYAAVHELLSDPDSPSPKTIALLLANAAQRQHGGDQAGHHAGNFGGNRGGAVVWSDPHHELYPPALVSASPASVDLRRLILLRCANPADELWALAECLRCKGVSATVASVSRLTQIQARRLQLAAERGGGVGLFMRPHAAKASAQYAAATRWHVRPTAGTEKTQRWKMELLHGHGRQVGQVVLIEVNRETRAMRSFSPAADRQISPSATQAWA